jgi:pimeloyl-ACP methyl ester carboxylesterase
MFTRTLHFLWQPQRRLASHLALLATLVIAGPTAAAIAATPAKSDAPITDKPTIVLVHGAWADSSIWKGVVQRLQGLGYPVRVPPVPLRSLSGDSANLSRFVSTIEGPIVLVGHSYGGGVITNMPIDPDVTALVYVDAFAPAQGEELITLPGPGSALAVEDPTSVFDFVPYSGGPDGDVDIYLKQDIFRTAFANDLSTGRADVLWAAQRPVTASALHEPSGAPAWKSLPSWYVLGTRDLVIPPATQEDMAERADSTLTRIKAGHLSPVSRPGAVTEVIEAAARATAD